MRMGRALPADRKLGWRKRYRGVTHWLLLRRITTYRGRFPVSLECEGWSSTKCKLKCGVDGLDS